MDPVLERLPSGARVAVIRLRSLGDCVLTTPALALLKSHRPDLEIGVVVEDRFAAVFEGSPDVAEILPPIAGAVRKWRPAAVFNLHGGTRSMALATTSGAPIRAGFAHHAYSFLYTDRIPRAQQILGVDRPVHTAEHLASAMFWAGVPHARIPRARLFPRDPNPPLAGGYAVIHPFASAPDKTWPAERFAAVARHWIERAGLETVFLAGPADDPSPFERFRVWRNEPVERLKRLMAGAHLFIGNDSGPAHMAAAFGVPVVVLFGPSDPVTWAPWRTEAQVLASPGRIDGITVDQVIAAAAALKVPA
jgi:ADP-heptose:LPS heptosyltransferase